MAFALSAPQTHGRIAMAIAGGRGTNFNVAIQLNRLAALAKL